MMITFWPLNVRCYFIYCPAIGFFYTKRSLE